MPGMIGKHGNKVLERLSSKIISKQLSDPLFRAKMSKLKLVKINREYDIPYVSGHSKNGLTVYIDRHFPTDWEGNDITPFLKAHEVAEKAMMDLKQLTRPEIEYIANCVERMAVEKAGINYKKYSQHIQKYMKKIEHEQVNKAPKDLDLTPYADEKTKNVLIGNMGKMKTKRVVTKVVRESVGLPLTETKISLQYHDELNPKLWDGFKLKDAVRNKLLEFAYSWCDFAKISLDLIQDIIILGGNANYNYTDKSDIDVHVIIDRNKLNPDRAFVDEYLQDKKVLWTMTHKVTILGLPLEPYAQDSTADFPSGQGVYSLKTDKWLQRPIYGKIDFSKDINLKKKVMFYAHMIDSMIKDKMDLGAFKDLKNKISTMRGAAIAKGGEFSFENLVFKELRNRGYLDKMNKYEKTVKDQQLSL